LNVKAPKDKSKQRNPQIKEEKRKENKEKEKKKKRKRINNNYCKKLYINIILHKFNYILYP
jgi:hypothetical protein